MLIPTSAPIKLIVNADDFGYYPHVSQGILTAAQQGCVTATGIMANGYDSGNLTANLRAIQNIDLGVHLNLTFNKPLSPRLKNKLATWHGEFPGLYTIIQMILFGKISLEDVRTEFRNQIEACNTTRLYFLNSHEHIHMLPTLFPLTLQLANEYNIPYVRITQPDWLPPFKAGVLFRNAMMQMLSWLQLRKLSPHNPVMIGLSGSGQLSNAHLEKLFAKLKPGKVYELMCHPGTANYHKIRNDKVADYHDWPGELALLKSDKLLNLYKIFNIALTRYSELNG